VTVPAFHGIEPQISLAYSSTSGNGFAGVGWSLGAGSTIQRASSFSGGAPAYNGNDLFMLDGQPLVPCASGSSSPSCTTGGTHSTRIENYSRITFNAGSDTWTVTGKTGTVATYVPLFVTGWGVFRWALQSVVDTNGNLVWYNYWCDPGNECYLDNIQYNGTSIQFWRDSRSDEVTYAVGAGMLATMRYRLKSIDVQVSGNRLRTYALGYTTSGSSWRSVLTSVQQYGRDATLDGTGTVTGGSALPPFTLSTAAATPSLGWEYGGNSFAGNATLETLVQTGDFNGDGKADSYFHWSDGHDWVGVSTGSSVAWQLWSTAWPGNGTIQSIVQTGDFNGDGKTDVYFHWSDGNDWVGVSTGAGFNWELWSTAWTGNDTIQSIVRTGDFNGDGKTDVYFHWSDGNDWVGVSTGAGFSWQLWANGFAGNATIQNIVRVADFNGDGKTDVYFHWSDGNDWVGLSTGAGFSWQLWSTNWTGNDTLQSLIQTADFNGDGKSDLYFHWSDGNDWVGVSTGSGFNWQLWSNAWAGNGTLQSIVKAGDFNGDGRDDVYFHWSDGNDWVGVSTGSGFNWQLWGNGFAGNTTIQNIVRIADFNGDGKTDVYFRWSDGNDWLALTSGPIPDLVNAISNGTGGTTGVTYAPSSSWSNTYLPVSTVFQTVTSTTVGDGRGNTSTTSYQYQGGLWSASEQRFLGFRYVKSVVDAAGDYAETYYHQGVGDIAKPDTTYFKDPSGNIYMYTSNSYTENDSPPYTSMLTTRWDYECNETSSCRRVATQFEYDQYGNVVNLLDYGDYDKYLAGTGTLRSTWSGFYPNTSAFLVGVKAYENVYGAQNGGAWVFMAQTLYQYDGSGTYAAAPSRGNLTTSQTWNSTTGGYSVSTKGYDGYGNQTSSTDPLGHTSTVAYDGGYHVYPVRRCNALGQCSSTGWDYVLGMKTSETDANNATTTVSYDAFGRPTRETGADGTYVAYQYLSWGDPNNQRTRKFSPDGLWVDTYVDGLQRTFQEVRANGDARQTLYDDATKRVWKSTAWYAPGEAPQYSVYAYDGVGRQRTVTNPDGSSASTTYGTYGGGTAVTLDELGHEHVIWKNTHGATILVREKNTVGAGCSASAPCYYYTSYTLDALDRITEVVDASGNAATYAWSSLGKKTAQCDPDTGCWSYGYDAAGNLTRTTDAKNQTKTFTYDAVGRQTRVTYPDGTSATWTYDQQPPAATSPGAIGRLTESSNAAGYTTYGYDVMGRATYVGRCVNAVSACHSISYGYDAYGRLSTTATWPEEEETTTTYDGNGRPVTLKGTLNGATTTYVSNATYNARGQVTSLSYGNGTTTNNTYDPARQWLTSAAVTLGSTTIYQASYAYDRAARITASSSSTDYYLDNSYGYDDLNRLVAVGGAQNQSFAYDPLGNITSKSDVGTYGYTAPHAHAVSAAGGTSYTYDANGNMTGGNGRTISWSYDNLPTQVTTGSGTTTLAYGADGDRMYKSGPAGTYGYFPEEELQNWAWVRYYTLGGMTVARRDSTGSYWYHTDHVGSVHAITNASGAKVEAQDYAPFGSTVASSGSVSDDYGFDGQRTDPDMGLVYMNARYYDARLGRFISADSVVPSDDPQALNRYAFAYNNPIANSDPSGHAPVVAAVVAVASFVASNAVVISATVGVAASVAGYITHNPILSTIGAVALGFAGGEAFGAGVLAAPGLQGGLIGGAEAALTSPLSPLPGGFKTALGWAFTATGLFDGGQLNYVSLGMSLSTAPFSPLPNDLKFALGLGVAVYGFYESEQAPGSAEANQSTTSASGGAGALSDSTPFAGAAAVATSGDDCANGCLVLAADVTTTPWQRMQDMAGQIYSQSGTVMVDGVAVRPDCSGSTAFVLLDSPPIGASGTFGGNGAPGFVPSLNNQPVAGGYVWWPGHVVPILQDPVSGQLMTFGHMTAGQPIDVLPLSTVTKWFGPPKYYAPGGGT
jgi:RHS repeat-associated protein